MSAVRQAALKRYAELGMPVHPHHASGIPWTGWRNPTDDAQEVAEETRTFGVNLGGNYVVVDVDADRGGDLSALEAEYPLPPTMTVTTPSGERNFHLYYRVRGDELRTCKSLTKKFPHIDFIGAGGHVKGATSRRKIASDLSLAYIEQEPRLDPEFLPQALENEWRALQPASAERERREFLDAALAAAPVAFADDQREYCRTRIQNGLDYIKAGTDGDRHDRLVVGSRDVFWYSVLLEEEPNSRMDDLSTAYQESGGQDDKELRKQLDSVLEWTLENPAYPPSVSAVLGVDDLIGRWADAATASFPSRATKIQALIRAVSVEARMRADSDDVPYAEMSTAVTVLVKRHPDIGDQTEAAGNMAKLRERGLLAKTGERPIANGKPVVEYALVIPLGTV